MIAVARHRTVADVMTTHVHVATPLTPFKELVRLIHDNHVSALPVVDTQGMPVGVVSESDLVLKERLVELAHSDNPVHLWRRHQEHAKARGVVAGELMTSPAISIGADASISDAARLMQSRRIRRLIVVDGRGRIAGIVTRSDLLRVFLRSDDELRDEMLWKVIPSVLLPDEQPVEVSVAFNVITLAGEVYRRSDVEILGRLAGEIDGAVDVINNLSFRWDDLQPHARVN